jgi:3',5'-nucleoside bisphosphate phosphatase
MLRRYQADLHVHTCLSPCAEIGMSPRAIARRARALRIDIVGICDHNSAENAPAALEAARGHGPYVLPGMELTTSEEIHVLALFDTIAPALELQERVYRRLPGENDEAVFGMQVIADAEDEVLGFSPRLLIGATTFSLQEAVDTIRALGGLVVAAHVDRESFSLIGQLGFVPEGLALDALEISAAMSLDEAQRRFEPSLPLLRSSDAHRVEEIGRCRTVFLIEEASIEEIRKALEEKEGRKVVR